MYLYIISFYLSNKAPLPPLPTYIKPPVVGIFMLNNKDLVLEDKLGQGNFGSVQKGTYKHLSGPIPVAVKVLKTGDMPHAEVSRSAG